MATFRNNISGETFSTPDNFQVFRLGEPGRDNEQVFMLLDGVLFPIGDTDKLKSKGIDPSKFSQISNQAIASSEREGLFRGATAGDNATKDAFFASKGFSDDEKGFFDFLKSYTAGDVESLGTITKTVNPNNPNAADVVSSTKGVIISGEPSDLATQAAASGQQVDPATAPPPQQKAPIPAPVAPSTFTEVQPDTLGLTFEDLERAGGEGATITNNGKKFVITPLGTLRPVEEAVAQGAIPSPAGAPATGVPKTPQTPQDIIEQRPELPAPAAPPTQPIDTTPPAGGAGGELAPDRTAQINEINRVANDDTQNEANTIETSNVNVRESDGLTGRLEDLFTTERPTAPSLQDQFSKLLAESGVEPIQGELAQVQNNIRAVQTNLINEAAAAGELLVPVAQINRRKGKLQQAADARINLLRIEEDLLQRQVSNKLNTIGMTMDFLGQDVAQANQQYNQEFNQQLQLISLIRDIEEVEQDRVSETRDTALANLGIIMNSITDGGVDFNNLTQQQRTQINEMELMAGLPIGFVSQLKTSVPNEKILSTTTRTSNGTKFVDIVTQSPDGQISAESINIGSVSGGVSTGDTLFTLEGGEQIDISTVDGIKRLQQEGFGHAEIFAFLDNNVKSLTNTAIKGLLKEAGIEETGKTFLDKEFLRGLFTTKQLEEAAADAGFGDLGKGFFNLKDVDVEAYLGHLETIIEQFRKSGLSDEEILKRMQ